MVTPEAGSIYQHKYGGIYSVLAVKAISSEDASEWVVYTHIYPFPSQTYIRPVTEWSDGRFTKINQAQMSTLMQEDRNVFETQIRTAQAAATSDVPVEPATSV